MWRAQYEIAPMGDRGATPYEVDVTSCECPVAMITPESLDWVQDFMRAGRVREATGGVLYGPDSSQWPAVWFDVVDVLQMEIAAEKAAFSEALATRK